MRIPRTAAVLAAVAAAACVRDPDPLTFSDDVVAVHAVLHAFQTEPRVWVRRSTFSGDQREGAASATLESGGATVALVQAPAGDPGCTGDPRPEAMRGCMRGTLPEPVAPGSRWTVTASVAGVGTVRGSTTVPLLPVVTRPAAELRVPFRSGGMHPEGITADVELEWSAPGAPRVEFTLRAATVYAGGAALASANCHAAHEWIPAAIDRSSGSRTIRIEALFCADRDGRSVAWDSAALRLGVTAFDSAYANFALYGEGTSGRRSGLEGGYGVVGSAATAERRIMLVPAR